jgi:Rrf2 family protein
MFRINRRTDYAIRVMLSLARRPQGARLSTQMIQDEMLIPRPYLQRIIADLSRAGLVRTFLGASGGIELSKPAETSNLLQIWEAIEGPLLISDCLKAPRNCPLDQGCPVHRRWRRMQALIARELEGASLAQLAEEANRLAQSSNEAISPNNLIASLL